MNVRDAIFSGMVGQGWTLVAASGDEGATATWCEAQVGVFFPASDPYVVAAGGTTLRLDSYSDYIGETGWTGGPDGCDSNDGGSTGGFSYYWPTPGYQSAFGFGSRAVPDLALNADWYNTPQNLYFGGYLSGNGGTSIVAPELAGFFAQANAYLLSLGNVCGAGSSPCAPLGDPHAYLYDAGLYGPPHKPFYDITSGCNDNDVTAYYSLGYYCAGTGFDQVTGWGSANMLQLAWAINWYSAAAAAAPAVSFDRPVRDLEHHRCERFGAGYRHRGIHAGLGRHPRRSDRRADAGRRKLVLQRSAISECDDGLSRFHRERRESRLPHGARARVEQHGTLVGRYDVRARVL
jgi:subtilase family serine protease